MEFLESDLMEKAQGEFDVVVANLPYVDRTWPWISGVEDEPELALYAEDGGLEIIFRLLKQVRGRAKYLILEADPCQHDRIEAEIKKYNFELEKINGYQVLAKAYS